eukprot:TRINITY_DN475_c0_g1_i1.p1 TRINITY_DN475_c0_g1~~TRINITY_DN475_c0_g1_i1.p1  ORF type:complete len:798 (+),score=207.17 TRINITY_DN475_c0_g1_i1:69-2462(+)
MPPISETGSAADLECPNPIGHPVVRSSSVKLSSSCSCIAAYKKKQMMCFVFLATAMAHIFVTRAFVREPRRALLRAQQQRLQDQFAQIGSDPSTTLPVGAVDVPVMVPDPGIRSEPMVNAVGNHIVAENRMPGTQEWRIQHPSMHHEVEGYASLTSVNKGGKLQLFTSARNDTELTLRFFRTGWYNGDGAREVRDPVTLPGVPQILLEVLDADDPMRVRNIECDWVKPYDLEVPANWTTGVYLVLMTGSQSGLQSYIIFVVRDDDLQTDYLMTTAVTTYHAYNPWGGRTSYPYTSFIGGCCAEKLSFNRPYAPNPFMELDYGVGAGEYISNYRDVRLNARSWGVGWEYTMVRWLEGEGYNVKYVTSVDVHQTPEVFDKTRAFLSIGHDEYWSRNMRVNVESALNRGVSMAFLGANAAYFVVEMEESPTTLQQNRMMKLTTWHSMKENWRYERYYQPESNFIGIMFTSEMDGDFQVHHTDHWVFDNTNFRPGDSVKDLIGYEGDRIHDHAPPCLEHVSWHSTVAPDGQAQMADTTVYVHASGATVFAAGSIRWAWALDDWMPTETSRAKMKDERIVAMTKNVLKRLIEPRPQGPYKVYADAFNSSSLDTELWCRSTVMEGHDMHNLKGIVNMWNSHLAIQMEPRNGSQAVGINSRGVLNFSAESNLCPAVRLAQVTLNGGASFGIVADRLRWFRFFVWERGTMLTAQMDMRSVFHVPYDRNLHSHFRFRYNPSADWMYFETSPEPTAQGYSWTTLHMTQPWFPVTQMHVELSAIWLDQPLGVVQGDPILFENFRLERC